MSSRTRIVVVDDSPLFAEAMAVQLDECDDLQLVGSAMDGPAALALLQWAACDVVVLAHPLDGDDGLGVARSVLALRPGPAAVMLSDGSRDGCILEAVALGVRGWVWRNDKHTELLAALRAVARGETHLPVEPVRRLLADRIVKGPVELYRKTGPHVLTRREEAVLKALAAGLTRKEIGEQLQLSPNTVRTHVRSILRKFHVHSAPDAVALFGKVLQDE